MTKQRTLADLYVRGRELTFDDGVVVTEADGTVLAPPSVWIQKLNPVEHSQATRKADAARAKTLTIKFDKECEEYLAILNDVLSADREILIEILAIAEGQRVYPISEAKIADEEAWKADNYLQGLRDAWSDGVKDAFELDAEDVEAKRVHDELQRFIDLVNADVASQVESCRMSLRQTPHHELVEMSMDKRVKDAADISWVNEYYRSEMAIGTRYIDDHKKRYFPTREDVDILQLEAYLPLAMGFRQLTVEPVEGKDLAESPPSSDS